MAGHRERLGLTERRPRLTFGPPENIELNQNPSKAVARVRAGASILVTDRGKAVLRMVPETGQPTTLQSMVASGEAQAPAELGMPDIVPDLAAGLESLADLVVADRDRERRR